MLTSVFGDNLVQPGPVGIPAGQFSFRILFTDPPYDSLPCETSGIDVHEGNITNGACSEGRVLTTLFTTPGGNGRVSEISRSRSLSVLVGDNPGDLLTAHVEEAVYALFYGS